MSGKLNDKPKAKTEVAVTEVHRSVGIIAFYSSGDAVEDFSDFGKINKVHTNLYHLFIDRRFDCDEVVKYMKSYGAESE